MVNIQENVGVFAIQFIIANARTLPKGLRGLARTREGRAPRAAGTKVVPETELVSLAEIPEQLEALGFELVDGHFEPRPGEKRCSWKVRYFFARKEVGHPIHPGFAHHRNAAREGLGKLVRESLWRARAFLNPPAQEPTHPEGWPILSVDADNRTARLQPDGSPVLVWRRNEAAEKIGEAPIPIAPTRVLRIADGRLESVPSTMLRHTSKTGVISPVFLFHASPCSPDRLRLVSDPRPSP